MRVEGSAGVRRSCSSRSETPIRPADPRQLLNEPEDGHGVHVLHLELGLRLQKLLWPFTATAKPTAFLLVR